MNSEILFDRCTDTGCRHSSSPEEIWENWRGPDERWMFVSAHDDDIVCGAGLTLLAGLRCGADVTCVVATNGMMGYCRPEHSQNIAAIRRDEMTQSFAKIGVTVDKLFRLGFSDGDVIRFLGRRFATSEEQRNGDISNRAGFGNFVIAGATGLQNSFTWVLRQVRPTRVFLPVHTDLHPDHRYVHHEFIISVFHAQGGIWPELGPATSGVPYLYEYPTYSDFAAPPDIRIRTSHSLLEQKLAGIAEYKSQEQIELIVAGIRNGGPQEYVRSMTFDILKPHQHDDRFGQVGK